MTLRLGVDAKALTIAYLKAHTSVAAICAGRVSDRAKNTFPQVTVISVGGRELVTAGGYQSHLDETHLQIDCWGERSVNDQETTQLLARTVRAAMLEMSRASHTLGGVSGVRTITPPHDFADDLRARVTADYGVITLPAVL